jgi:hypothetical protein
MSDAFLEGQLRRIRELTERMSQVQSRTAELSVEIARDRMSMRQNPLADVRDLRVIDRPESRSRRRR